MGVRPAALTENELARHLLARLQHMRMVFLPAGIVCGHCALHSVRKTGEPGEGMARAGLTLGYLGLVVTPLLLKWTHFQ